MAHVVPIYTDKSHLRDKYEGRSKSSTRFYLSVSMTTLFIPLKINWFEWLVSELFTKLRRILTFIIL